MIPCSLHRQCGLVLVLLLSAFGMLSYPVHAQEKTPLAGTTPTVK
ncbi:hypothetical protein [Taibaiella helva]|nr:hypothetical protein [Taibaiella helva]